MARKRGGLGDFLDLWARHETLYVSVFREALGELHITDEQRNHEDAISEALCPVLKRVCFQRAHGIVPPRWNCPIPPDHEADLRGGKSAKRPDFTCSLIDPHAQSPETYELSFHIECKRLGETVGSWNLNKNYVDHGVCRFDCATHKYGCRVRSGMMVGYMINMDFGQIQTGVNEHLRCEGLPELAFKRAEKTMVCNQPLRRTRLRPPDFTLIHLWADVRAEAGK